MSPPSVEHEVLGRGRRRGSRLFGAMLVASALCGISGCYLWRASAPPPEEPRPQPRRDANAGLGTEFTPAIARAAPPPVQPAIAREEREPAPPPAAPPEPPPATPRVHLAQMWGAPGLKSRVPEAQRSRGSVPGRDGNPDQPGEEPTEFQQRMRSSRYSPAQPSPVRFNATYTVPPGTKVNCVPDSPVSSEMVGPVDCSTQGDVRSMDGTMVLIPDNSRIHGMIEKGLGTGERRLFVVWQYAITPGPDWLMIPLDAPGADPMGQMGVPGDLDRRIWERYGPTLALSVIDFGVGAATSALRDTGGSVFNFGSIGNNTGRTLGQMAFERDQNIPRVVTRGPARTLVVYVPRPIDLRRFYSLREAR